VRTVLPIDLELLASLGRGPGVIRDNGYPTQRLKAVGRLCLFDDDRSLHAGDFARGRVVEVFQLATENWRPLNRGVDHTGQMGIETVHGAPGANVFQIDNRNALADVFELGSRLQADLRLWRNWLFGGCGNQFAKTEFPPCRRVNNLMVFGAALAGRNLPLLGSGAFEHETSGCARFAHNDVEVANGHGTVGVLRAVQLAADRLLHVNAVPIGVELVRDNHGQRRSDTSAHFRAVSNDNHGSIGIEANVDARVPGRFRDIRGGAARRTGTLAVRISAPAEKSPLRKWRRLASSMRPVGVMPSPPRRL